MNMHAPTMPDWRARPDTFVAIQTSTRTAAATAINTDTKPVAMFTNCIPNICLDSSAVAIDPA
jgi:hypothetical protein